MGRFIKHFDGGAVSAFYESVVLKDAVFYYLLSNDSSNEETIFLLQKLFSVCASVMEKQLADQLPGGKFWEPSEMLIKEAASCSSSNISGERKFAVADRILAHVEGKVMFRTNKTREWMRWRIV